jgi:hypothetical protein
VKSPPLGVTRGNFRNGPVTVREICLRRLRKQLFTQNLIEIYRRSDHVVHRVHYAKVMLNLRKQLFFFLIVLESSKHTVMAHVSQSYLSIGQCDKSGVTVQ